MRIAYLADFSPRKLGTGENRMVAFARAGRERGHQVRLFFREPVHPDVAAALEDCGAMWERLDDVERSPLAAGRRMAREFDVVQLNMLPSRSRAALAAYAAWPARVLFVDRVSRGPQDGESTGSWPRRWLDRLTVTRIHQYAGISEYVRGSAMHRFGLPERRTVTIYNGVDTDRFHPRNDERPAGTVARVVVVANLIAEKGVDVLIRAMARLKTLDWQLDVIGDGPLSGELQALCTQLGILDRVSFLGLRDDVPELLRRADVAVHPATWGEAFGNTVAEAMASGCCLVASRTGAIPEIAIDGSHALLVEPGDVSALASAIQRALDDPGLRRALGSAARARVEQSFSLPRYVARQLDWCEAAADGRLL
jgi:glycosyltransferase involved in cell wall biosynthesis